MGGLEGMNIPVESSLSKHVDGVWLGAILFSRKHDDKVYAATLCSQNGAHFGDTIHFHAIPISHIHCR